MATFTLVPAPTELGWRSLEGAGFLEDTIKVTPRLEVRAGFRSESTNGWNEAQGRASNYAHRQRRAANHAHRGQLGALDQPREIPAQSAPGLCLGRVGQRQDGRARRRRALPRPARHARLPARPDRALQHRRIHQEHRGLEPELHAGRAAAIHRQGVAQQRAARSRHARGASPGACASSSRLRRKPRSPSVMWARTATTRFCQKT